MTAIIISLIIAINGAFNDGMEQPCSDTRKAVAYLEQTTGAELTVYEDCSIG